MKKSSPVSFNLHRSKTTTKTTIIITKTATTKDSLLNVYGFVGISK